MRKFENKILIKNLSYAFIAQIISLLSSFSIQFFAPKVLNVEEFAYWQLFLFYVSYINISRLGILDGIYLRLGGEKRENLELGVLKKEYFSFITLQVFVAIIMAVVSLIFIVDMDRLFVILCCSICLLIINSNNFFGFLFQAINETSIYSVSEIIYNLFWFLALLNLLIFKIGSFYGIIIFYIIGQVIAGIYLMYKGRFILRAKVNGNTFIIKELIKDGKIGLPLLISMYAGMLITGVARLIVDGKWGIEFFGYFSFAMSLTTFILKFISQVSMVLFPALRSVDEENRRKLFIIGEKIMTLFLPAILVFYVPIKFAISWWLPQYATSLTFFGILLPICIFDGKMQLLYSTYLKVLGKQKYLLYVNIIAVITSFVISLFSAYVFGDIQLIAWGLLLSVIIRCFIADFLLSKWMEIKKNYILTITGLVVIIIFAILSSCISDIELFFIYLLMLISFFVINYKSMIELKKSACKVKNHK